MSSPGFTLGLGLFFAVGVGGVVTKPLVPKVLAIVFGLLMALQGYVIVRRHRDAGRE